MNLNKSYLTNGIALLIVIVGFLIEGASRPYLISIGMFALSGSLTNTIAIHMLFEKVPLFYGSGVIVLKFEAFKTSIASMVMKQFFTLEHIEKFTKVDGVRGINLEPIMGKVSLKPAFEKLIGIIMNSSMGGMLGMFGGESVLRQFEAPFEEKMREAIVEMTAEESFQALLKEHLIPKDSAQIWLDKIEDVVLARLDELTPEMVKEMIEKIIHEHLGWLVVWGGVFGGLIGLVSAFFMA